MKKKKYPLDKIPENLDEIVKIRQCRNFLRKTKINRRAWNTIDKVEESRFGFFDNYPTSEAVTTPVRFRFY